MRGFGVKVNGRKIKNLISIHSPKIVFLQETKVDALSHKIFQSMWEDPDVDWLLSPCYDNSGGLLSLWHKSFFSANFKHSSQLWLNCSVGI